MTAIICTRTTAGVPYTGYVYAVRYRLSSTPEFKALTLPTGIETLDVRPSFVGHQGRTYIGGMFSRILEVAEDETVRPLGLHAPTKAVTVTEVAGTPGIEGSCQVHLTYRCKQGNRVLQESNPGPPSTAIKLVGGFRQITGAPSTAPDPHATHVGVWVSMFGGIPRFSMDAPISGETLVDGMSTAVLANQPALPNDGAEPNYTHGVPPYGRYLAVQHNRLWIAGDPAHPYRVWYSERDKFHAVGLSNYIDTRNGETITGIYPFRDYLLVFCRRSTHLIRGYGDGDDGLAPDVRIDMVDPQLGCICHHSIVNINGRLWYTAEDGIRIWTGESNYVMDDLRSEWAADFAANPTKFFNGFAIDDKVDHTYKFCPYDGLTTKPYVGHYLYTDPKLGGSGGPPYWIRDRRTRIDTCYGSLIKADGSLAFVTGSSDGYIREENYADNIDDDGDSYAKAWTIRTKHYLWGEPGASIFEGKTVVRLWSYIESESSTWGVRIYGGDEAARSQGTPSWDDPDIIASYLSIGGSTWVPKSVHYHLPTGAVGRGHTFEWFGSSTNKNFRWRGFGGEIQAGPAFRGKV